MVTEHSRYIVKEWENKNIDTYWAHLYVAGDYNITKNKLREIAFPSGLCVTIEKLEYIYAGGVEEGVRIGLIQYPPFPEAIISIRNKMMSIGYKIAELNAQWSFTIVMPDITVFCSRRDK